MLYDVWIYLRLNELLCSTIHAVQIVHYFNSMFSQNKSRGREKAQPTFKGCVYIARFGRFFMFKLFSRFVLYFRRLFSAQNRYLYFFAMDLEIKVIFICTKFSPLCQQERHSRTDSSMSSAFSPYENNSNTHSQSRSGQSKTVIIIVDRAVSSLKFKHS